MATLHGDVDQILDIVKEPVAIEDILNREPGKALQCVLVEGAPGIGKTTLGVPPLGERRALPAVCPRHTGEAEG